MNKKQTESGNILQIILIVMISAIIFCAIGYVFYQTFLRPSEDKVLSEIKYYFQNDNIKLVGVDKQSNKDIKLTLLYDGITFSASSIYNPNNAGGFGGATISTNFLENAYVFYKDEITKIAQKYDLDIAFTNNPSDRSFLASRKNILITASSMELDSVHKFALDVIKINNINKIYKARYKDGLGLTSGIDNNMAMDTSLITISNFDSGEDVSSFSIFEEACLNKTQNIK